MDVEEVLKLVIENSKLGKYKLLRKIGGSVYLAKNLSSDKEVAVKVEPVNSPCQSLSYEYNVYKVLQGGHGIPKVFGYSTTNGYNAIITELLGANLEDLFDLCGRKFSLKTVLMLAVQMITFIEFLHNKNFLHRDLTPNNILIGIGESHQCVYLTAFGHVKRYIDKHTHQHICVRENKNPTGTSRYTSVNDHLGIEMSRRDDLEALGYMIVYFLRGFLPWQGLNAANKEQKYELVLQMKLEIPLDVLCRDFPPEISTYLAYCRDLKFAERPDYDYCRRMFEELLNKCDNLFDFRYDWLLLEDERIKQSAAPSTSEFSETSKICAGNTEKREKQTTEDQKIGKKVNRRQRQKAPSQETKSNQPKLSFQHRDYCEEESSRNDVEDFSFKKPFRTMPRRRSVRIREMTERREVLVSSAEICARYQLKPVTIIYSQGVSRQTFTCAKFVNEVRHAVVEQNPKVPVATLHLLMAAMWREYLASNQPCSDMSPKRIKISKDVSEVGAVRLNIPGIERPFTLTDTYLLLDTTLALQEQGTYTLPLPNELTAIILESAIVEESREKILARESLYIDTRISTSRLSDVSYHWRILMRQSFFRIRLERELQRRVLPWITLSEQQSLRMVTSGFNLSNVVAVNEKIYGFRIQKNVDMAKGMVYCNFVTFVWFGDKGLRIENSRKLLMHYAPWKVVSESNSCLLVAAFDDRIYRMRIEDLSLKPVKYCPNLTSFEKIDESRYLSLQTLSNGSAQICLYNAVFELFRVVELPPAPLNEPYVFAGYFSNGNFLVGNKFQSTNMRLTVVDGYGQVASSTNQIELDYPSVWINFGFGLFDCVLVPSANPTEIKVFDRFLNLAFRVPTIASYSSLRCCENNQVLLRNSESLSLLKINFNSAQK